MIVKSSFNLKLRACLTTCPCLQPDGSLGRGFGDMFNWWMLEGGMTESNRTGKVAMLVAHKGWCEQCQKFGASFSQELSVRELASQFVMINIYDEEEPADPKYNPNGHGYVPRVMFFAPDGSLLDEFWSGHNRHMFFYRSAQQVVKTCVRSFDIELDCRVLLKCSKQCSSAAQLAICLLFHRIVPLLPCSMFRPFAIFDPRPFAVMTSSG